MSIDSCVWSVILPLLPLPTLAAALACCCTINKAAQEDTKLFLANSKAEHQKKLPVTLTDKQVAIIQGTGGFTDSEGERPHSDTRDLDEVRSEYSWPDHGGDFEDGTESESSTKRSVPCPWRK